MKIGLVVYECPKDQSGGYLYDRKIVGHLRGQGHEVFVYTFPLETARVIKDDVEVLIEDELCHADLLEFNRHLKSVSSIPVIALVHHLKCLEPAPHQEEQREEERKFLTTCDAVIANSNSTSRSVTELGIRLPTLVAYPGCDRVAPAADFGRELPETFVNLLFVGILIPRKGVHVLLDALGELQCYPWKLRIVGDESLDVSYVESLRERALRLGNRVEFLGRVSPKELPEIYLDSDIFILPSYFEGYGIVVAEAVLHLLPTIASRVGGIPEIVQDGKEGILVPPGDKSALKQALQDFLEHPEHLKPFIEACEVRRHSLPTWQEAGEVIEDFLLRFRHERFGA
jgi:glycosyltransferase involved in cell wall biosynthesis